MNYLLLFTALFAAAFLCGWKVRTSIQPRTPGRRGNIVTVRRAIPKASPHRVQCAWCGLVLQRGVEPISHGICEECKVEFRRDFQNARTIRLRNEASHHTASSAAVILSEVEREVPHESPVARVLAQ